MEWSEILLQEALKWHLGSQDNTNRISKFVILILGGNVERILPYFDDDHVEKIGNFYNASVHETTVSVASTNMGSPGVEAVMRALSKTNAKYIIALGWAGALQEYMNIGELLIPTLAERGESTTGYYVRSDCLAKPDLGLVKKIEKLLQEYKYRHHLGPVYSTAAQFNERERFISRLNKENLLGIEMECSTLFVLSRIQRQKSAAILTISDSPLKKESHILDKRFEEKEESGFRHATDVAFKLIRDLSSH